MSPTSSPSSKRIDPRRLEQLEAKEVAHDDYLAAIRATRGKLAALDSRAAATSSSVPHPGDVGFAKGYRQALTDLSEEIIRAGLLRG